MSSAWIDLVNSSFLKGLVTILHFYLISIYAIFRITKLKTDEQDCEGFS